MEFSLVVAADEKMGIGKDNRLPWPRLGGDMKYFAEVTTGAADGKINAVVMGRKTWESLPDKSRPLKERLNVVLSRSDLDLPESAVLYKSFDQALEEMAEHGEIEKVFVIGGANVFEQALTHPACKKIYLTEVLATFDCDTFLGRIPEYFEKVSESEVHEDNGVKYKFTVLERD